MCFKIKMCLHAKIVHHVPEWIIEYISYIGMFMILHHIVSPTDPYTCIQVCIQFYLQNLFFQIFIWENLSVAKNRTGRDNNSHCYTVFKELPIVTFNLFFFLHFFLTFKWISTNWTGSLWGCFLSGEVFYMKLLQQHWDFPKLYSVGRALEGSRMLGDFLFLFCIIFL